MKKYLLLIGAFIFTILFGAWFTESVKIYKAEKAGYTARYSKGLGRNIFNSTERGVEYDKIVENAGSYDIAKMLPEYKEFARRDYHGHASFEIFTMVAVWSISVVGFILFILLLRKSKRFAIEHYLTLFLSLFFMRTVVLALVNLTLAYPCGEAKAITHYGVNPTIFQIVILGIGLLCLGAIIRKIPKRYKMRVIVSGAVGSVIGLALWMFLMGPLLFD